ncbi:cytochrome c3 family protein [Candidatus Poribacteria bacterium]
MTAIKAYRREMIKFYIVISIVFAVMVSLGVLVFRSTPAGATGGLYASTAHGGRDGIGSGVYRDGVDEPAGDCAHCHSGHSGIDYLLFTANDDNGLCFTCHSDERHTYYGQAIYNSSTHGSTGVIFNGKYVKQCSQCHTAHGEGDAGGLFPNLNKKLEDNVCWECHGEVGTAPDAVNIETQNDKPYAHNVKDFSRKHDDWEEWEETSHTPNPRLSDTIYGDNRHVECEDCHNDHYSKSGLHDQGKSEIPEVLLGAWGIKPTYDLNPWVTAISYEKVRFTNTIDHLEYYLCLKCHSDWAWGDDPPTTTDFTVQTNHAIEFNPNNPSYHNVAGYPAGDVPTHDVVYGSGSLAYINDWGPNSEMICTDCHSNDSSGSLATGPHGSIYNYMLKKRFKAVAGGLDNTGQEGTQDDLCFECHDWNTYSRNGTGTNTNFAKAQGAQRNLHAKIGHSAKAGCFTCHAAVIHGFKRKHFITYEVDGPPYYKGPAGEGLEAWEHNATRSYSKNDCRASCHTGHANANPANPEP